MRSLRGTVLRVLRGPLLIGGVALLLTACEREASIADLTQRQAIEVAGALTEGGVNATFSREGGSKGRYEVLVDERDLGAAVAILKERDLPSSPQPTFEELTSSSGFLPPSREVEAARLDRALASEVERLLTGASNSIAEARAVVRLNYRPAEEPASVSVVVERRPTSGDAQVLTVDRIHELVRRALPGVGPEMISVVETESPTRVRGPTGGDAHLVPFLIWRIPEQDYQGLALTVVGCILGMGILGALVGYWLGFYQYSRNLAPPAVQELDQGFLRVGSPTRGGRENEEG